MFTVEFDITELLRISAQVKQAIAEHDTVMNGFLMQLGNLTVIFLKGGSGAHRITGAMADSMKSSEAGDLYVVITSGVIYAGFEAARAGSKDGRTHNWIELGIVYATGAWTSSILPQIIKWFTDIFQ